MKSSAIRQPQLSHRPASALCAARWMAPNLTRRHFASNCWTGQGLWDAPHISAAISPENVTRHCGRYTAKSQGRRQMFEKVLKTLNEDEEFMFVARSYVHCVYSRPNWPSHQKSLIKDIFCKWGGSHFQQSGVNQTTDPSLVPLLSENYNWKTLQISNPIQTTLLHNSSCFTALQPAVTHHFLSARALHPTSRH